MGLSVGTIREAFMLARPRKENRDFLNQPTLSFGTDYFGAKHGKDKIEHRISLCTVPMMGLLDVQLKHLF